MKVIKNNGGSNAGIDNSCLRVTKRSIDHDESVFEENETTNK